MLTVLSVALKVAFRLARVLCLVGTGYSTPPRCCVLITCVNLPPAVKCLCREQAVILKLSRQTLKLCFELGVS